MSEVSSAAKSATVERTAVYNSTYPANCLLSVNMGNITKLTNTNYLKWHRQVEALLEGHKLHHFLIKTATTSESTMTVDGVKTPNTAYGPWRRHDQLLYSAHIGAISLTIQPLVASASTTHDVWSTLSSVFGTPTRGHIKQLKFQIKSCTKGTKTIAEYMRLMKTKADELALLGKPIDQEDLIEQIY